MTGFRMRLLLATAAAAAGLSFSAPTASAQSPAAPTAVAPATESISGVFPDGTRWAARKPASWNGTLLLDLDGAGFPAAAMPAAMPPPGAMPGGLGPPPRGERPYDAWLLSQGYAMGGTQREPVGYDFPKAVDYLVQVRASFTSKWSLPKRTLVTGGSRGAFVVRKSLELRPDIFDGGLMSAGGGAGEIAVLRNKLNVLFVLKYLIDPTAPLKLVNVSDAKAETDVASGLVSRARKTPEGRARLAFSAAMGQFAPWTSTNKPKPAPTDYEAQLDQIADNYPFAIAIPVRTGVEKISGGNVSWNTDADYGDLLRRSGKQPMVEALYKKAGLDLKADLATLAKAPRIKADPAAIRKAEPLMTYTGKIKDPLINLDNDDPVDPAPDKLAYVKTLRKAGTAGDFRLIWADAPGHGGMSSLDRAVAFKLLIERLDTGKWPDTSLPALKARAVETSRTTGVDLGRSSLFDPVRLAEPLNTWDAANWGTYKGR